jgi:hypothetical protein
VLTDPAGEELPGDIDLDDPPVGTAVLACGDRVPR